MFLGMKPLCLEACLSNARSCQANVPEPAQTYAFQGSHLCLPTPIAIALQMLTASEGSGIAAFTGPRS